MKSKLTIAFVASVASLLLGGFYWYEYRPAKLKQECSIFVTERSRLHNDIDDYAKWINDWTAVCVNTGGRESFVKSIKSGDTKAAKRKAAADADNPKQ